MKDFCYAFCILIFLNVESTFASESGMPQLNPEFWSAQIFWLIVIFSILYLIIWKIFLPKIGYSIENRKSKIVNDLQEAQKLKENTEKKLKEYEKIIRDSKIEAKKILEEAKRKLEADIEKKKEKFNSEIEEELLNVEKEIKNLKKSSVSSVIKISEELASEVVKQVLLTDVNKSSISAIVDVVAKKKMEKYT